MREVEGDGERVPIFAIIHNIYVFLDVRLMKHRAHVLHEQLKGFVQRSVNPAFGVHYLPTCNLSRGI